MIDVLTLSGPQPLWNVKRVASTFDVSEQWVYTCCGTRPEPCSPRRASPSR